LSNDIWVLAEVDETGKAKKIALELTSKATELAGQLGGAAVAVVLTPGGDGSAAATALGECGAKIVYVASDPRFASLMSAAQADALAPLLAEQKPRVLLVGATMISKDVAGRVAARLGLGLQGPATEIVLRDGQLVLTIPAFGSSVFVDCTFTGGDTGVIFVPANSFAVNRQGGKAEVVTFTPQIRESGLARLVEHVPAASKAPNLEEASIIVSGGRGLGGPEPFGILKELADLMGGAVGASRAAVDAGWIDFAYQVGQTGKTVKPNLYMAFGISGALQHNVGMRTSKNVVVINKDPDAPFFSACDLGIIGDLHVVIPALIAELKRRKGG